MQRRSSIGPSKSGGALKELGDLRSGIFLEINEILAGAVGINDFFQEKKKNKNPSSLPFLSFFLQNLPICHELFDSSVHTRQTDAHAYVCGSQPHSFGVHNVLVDELLRYWVSLHQGEKVLFT